MSPHWSSKYLLFGLTFSAGIALALHQEDMGKSESNKPIMLFLVIDGSSGWYKEATRAAVTLFQTKLQRKDHFQIAVFDSDPRDGNTLNSPPLDNYFFPLPAREPMREAIERCLNDFKQYSSAISKVIIILVHDESYPSWISHKQLLESSRKSGSIIYGVMLSARNKDERESSMHRVWRTISAGIVWILDGLSEGPDSSRKNTYDLLKTLSVATGGITCSANNKTAILECAKSISEKLLSAEGRSRLEISSFSDMQ